MRGNQAPALLYDCLLGKEHLNAEEIDNNPTDNNSPIHITTVLPTSPVDEEDEKYVPEQRIVSW